MAQRDWSAQQQAIFEWFKGSQEAQNLIVRARAGTGKTTTIVEAISFAPEQSILLCAFNKKIAEELTGRLTNPKAGAKTLHSIGFAAVRRYWSNAFVPREFSDIAKRADSLTQAVCGDRAPDAIKSLVSKLHSKGREIVPHATNAEELVDLALAFDLQPDEQWAREGFGVHYVAQKAVEAMAIAGDVRPVNGIIDFSDQIFLPVRNRWLSKTFDLVVVDEAQDMTAAQLEIARGVCSGRIAVVGDDRQAIYGFRGADSGSLDRLKLELNAKELGLTTTYRCGHAIVAAAAKLVPDFTAGAGNPEGEILEITSDKLVGDIANGDFLLSRKNAPLVGVAMALLRNGKRARIAGRDIGGGLKALVRKLAKGPASNSVPAFIEKVTVWQDRETLRFTKAGKDSKVEEIIDKAEMLLALAQEATSVRDIENRIDALFTDDGLGQAGVITCSSIHRSKGLEANRVFLLASTLYPGGRMDLEEQNLEYVAVTRAKQTLVMVYPEAK
jgi:superfamily I DNA/RNA helicase